MNAFVRIANTLVAKTFIMEHKPIPFCSFQIIGPKDKCRMMMDVIEILYLNFGKDYPYCLASRTIKGFIYDWSGLYSGRKPIDCWFYFDEKIKLTDPKKVLHQLVVQATLYRALGLGVKMPLIPSKRKQLVLRVRQNTQERFPDVFNRKLIHMDDLP